MAATQVQGIGAGKVLGPRTQELNYPSPPTQGNLLVCLANVDDGFTTVLLSAGWTKIDQTGADAITHGALATFWKIAGESEPTEVSLDYIEVNRRGGMILYEYSNPIPLSLDQFVATYDPVSNNVASTGTTPILSGDAVLAIAALSLPDDNANLAGTSWTNGFVGDLAAESAFEDFFTALKDLDGSDETLETTSTHNGTGETKTAGILVFKAAAGGGLASFRDAVATAAAAADAASVDAVARDVGA